MVIPNPGGLGILLGELVNRGRNLAPFLMPQITPHLGGRPIGSNSPTGTGFGLPRINTRTALSRPVSNRRQSLGDDTQNQENPLGSLYEALLSLLSSPAGLDTGDLRGQIDPVYDARRAALEQMISRAQTRVGEGRQDIEGMYEALGQDYERLAPEAAAQAQQGQQEVEQLYGQLKSNIEGNYARVAQEQTAMMQQLGIEAAAPAVLTPQSERAASAMSSADELGAINQQRYQDIGNIDQSYYRQGAPLARLQGSNLSADLLKQFEDFAAERSSDIAMNEAERTSAYNQLVAQSRAQQAQQQSQQTQMLWQMLRDMMGSGQSEEMNPQSFLGSLPPAIQQQAINTIRRIEKSTPVRTGQTQGQVAGTFVSTPETYYLDALDDMYQKREIDATTYQVLMQYFRMAGVGVGFG